VRILTWTKAASTSVDAGCPDVREWHLVAGWRGYPVAFVDVQSPIPPSALLLAPPFASTPYTAHVGDIVEVRVNLLGPGADTAIADPAYLRLVAAEAQGGEPVRYDWRWQAIQPGTTEIRISRHLPAGQSFSIRLRVSAP
jgi:hypothetical protein